MSDSRVVPNELCTLKTCSLDQAYSSYVPTFEGNVLYAAIFLILLVIQIWYGIRRRTWGFMIGMIGGLLLEHIGYDGRIQMHYNPFKETNFLMYLIPLTIGPAFLSAAIYLCLGRVVVLYGEEHSRLKPRTYTLIFIACDFLSLLLQAAGGAIASIADTRSLEQTGINIMVAGLAFQVASVALFIALCCEFAWRVSKLDVSAPLSTVTQTKLFKRFLIALTLATVCILIRCVFRVAELSGGFNGKLANQEPTFMILEGAMIVIASLALTAYHPGRCFQGEWTAANFGMRGKNVGSAEAAGEAEKGSARCSA